ncbi:MAG: nucleotide exchange factor GrpE [Candidatus Wallbacteria bacterium]|nr:nucleotide exchange factor GrpE [Candidatus Wallbacteria bacterium]
MEPSNSTEPEDTAKPAEAAAAGDAETVASAGNPATPAQTPAPESEELQKVRKELEEARQQSDTYRRHAAELDNIRKRQARERERDLSDKAASLLRGILPVVDNFERAMASLAQATDAEAVKVGTGQIYRLFVDWLEKQGVKAIPSVGAKYDPNLHEAVMQAPSPQIPEGSVSNELERGYFLGEKVLRHAKVVVSTGAPPESQTPQES